MVVKKVNIFLENYVFLFEIFYNNIKKKQTNLSLYKKTILIHHYKWFLLLIENKFNTNIV